MARRSKMAAWPVRLLFCVLGAMVPLVAAAQEHEVPLADLPINGEWEVAYADRDLGLVAGRGEIDEEGGSARVTFIHPVTGREFSLHSRSLSRTGTKITIDFEGKSPTGYRNDGLGYPQRHLIVPEETREVTVSIGASSANNGIAARSESDLDRLTLELTLVGQDKLTGTWRYKADPFTGRDRNGFGRMGVFEVRDDGSALQSGPETWTRPPPVVLGAFALEGQTGWNRDLNEPFYPHPYQDDNFHGKKTFRTIFIFGTDLPDGRDSRAVITSETEAVSYGRVIYPDSTFKYVRGHLKPFETGKARLLKIFEEKKVPTATAQATVEAFDYLVVEATLSEGVEPGFQEFSVNGSDGTWTLRFGNNGAEIRFVRAIDPTKIPNPKVDTFDFVLTNPDQSISRGRLNVEVTDKSREESVAPAKRTLVSPGESARGDLSNADTYGVLPGTIERLRRMGLFPRSGEANRTDKPFVRYPGTFGGRYGTLVLKKDGSFTYTAYPQVWTRDEFEQTNDAFIPETILVAVRTETVLLRDKILVTIGKNGAVQKMGGEERFPAYRVPGDPQLYLTDPILLTGSPTAGNGGGLEEHGATMAPPGKVQVFSSLPVFARLLRPPHPLTVAHGDKLSASIADPGLISLVPEPAKVTASISPARIPGGLSYLWKDHLKRAAACYPDLGEIDWNRSDNEFVATIEEKLNFKWWKVGSPILMLFPSEILKARFQLGDHAAMLMMRQAFIQKLTSKIEEYTFISNAKEELQAFWLMLSPYRWNVRQHALTNLKFEIEVTGPNGTQVPFRETYWNEYQQEARTYDRPGDVPDRFVRATREALQKYIAILSETLAAAKDVEECEVEDLVKLTGRHFQNVEAWLTPRIMRLDETSRRGWMPDYHGRLRVHLVADKLWQVRAHEKLSEEDTQQGLMVTAILFLPVTIASATAAVIVGSVGLGFEVYTEVPKYMESQTEITFALGTADILGYGRYEQAKADEYGGDKLAIVLLVAGASLAADVAVVSGLVNQLTRGVKFLAWARRTGIRGSVSVIEEVVSRFRFGVRYAAARRGKALLEGLGFDFSKVSAQVSARDFKGLVGYLAEAVRQRARRAWLGDSYIKALERLEARNKDWTTFVESSSADVQRVLKDTPPRAKLRKFMRSANEVVDDVLMSGGRRHDEAMAMLRYTPQTTPERFQRALEARMKLRTEPLGEGLYKLASRENRDAARLVSKGRWFINFDETDGPDWVVIKIRSPDLSHGVDEIVRGYDKGTGTLFMRLAFRDHVPGHINVGLAQKISPKGFPTFLFAQLRYLNWVGVGYGGKGGDILKHVVMKSITNARTNVQLTWFRKTFHPDKGFQRLVDEDLLADFLIHTRSVRYAKTVINMAGYRIKRVSLVLRGEGTQLKELKKYYKIGTDGETWEQFLKRYGLGEHDLSPPDFNIKIEVEPHPGAFRTTAANDNVPGPKGGGGDPNETQIFPEFEPPSDLPASVTDARRQADRLFREAEDTYGKVLTGEHKLPIDPNERAKELARLRSMVRAKNLQDGIEGAIRDARRIGIPEDAIEGILDRHMTRIDINPASARADTLLYLESAIREKQGYHVVDTDEAESLLGMLTRAQLGTSTDADRRLLAQKISDAEQQGGDFFDDLARTGTNNAFTQKDWRKTLLNRDFELLTNEQGIESLRKLAREGSPSPGKNTAAAGDPAGPAARPNDDVRLGRGDGFDGRRDVHTADDQYALERRLSALSEHEKTIVTQAAEGMRKLGVPKFNALDYASQNFRDVVAKYDNPAHAAGQLIAEGIMVHGSHSISYDSFTNILGTLLSDADAEKSRDAAAKRLGFAPLPSEIRPGWLYPAHR